MNALSSNNSCERLTDMVLKAGAGPRADCFGGMRMFPPGCCRAGGAPFSLLGTIYNKKPRHADAVTRLAATLAIGITLGSLDHPRLEASLSRSFSAVTVRKRTNIPPTQIL